jgi:hypothetical protein
VERGAGLGCSVLVSVGWLRLAIDDGTDDVGSSGGVRVGNEASSRLRHEEINIEVE